MGEEAMKKGDAPIKNNRAKHLQFHPFKGYINPHAKNIRRNLHHALLWVLGYYKDSPPIPIPKGFSYPNPQEVVANDKPQASWVGHSTFLFSIEGFNILTDPIWGERCSPVNFLGPKRLHPVPISVKDLPEIDYVLISHNHYDHLDKQTVQMLNHYFPWITWFVPLGVEKWFRKLGISRVVECDWWDTFTLKKHCDLKFTFVPAQHFSGRGIFDKNRTLWGGWVFEYTKDLETQKRVYFVGDTGYNSHQFKEIGERFNAFDLSLIPIGTYKPNPFMKPVHISPLEAVNIHMDVNSQLSIGGHWKTFRLSSEPLEQPPYDLYKAMQDKNIPVEKFRVLQPGQIINW